MKLLNLLPLLGLAAESQQAVINPGHDIQNRQWYWNRDQAHCIICVEYEKTQFNFNGSITIIEQAVVICQNQGPCQSLDYLNTFHYGWAPPEAVQAARNIWGSQAP